MLCGVCSASNTSWMRWNVCWPASKSVSRVLSFPPPQLVLQYSLQPCSGCVFTVGLWCG